MKKITLPIFILIITTLFYSCFINPFYKEKDLINVPATGKWLQMNDTTIEGMPFSARIWDIVQTKDKEYTISRQITERERQKYIARFFKIKGDLFADVIVLNSGHSHIDSSTHSLCKIRLKGNKMEVSMLNEDYLDECIKSNKYHLTHTVSNDYQSDGVGSGGMIFYTASADELQNFIRKNDSDKKLFYETLVLVRSQ
jgi:hypothetical protein